ncbi:MAG: ParB-like nuclease domain-containing protein [Candidatus Altiarchaeota archaeon]|nr:ParB-like nuclease domain-containing protein [Candidatus Altiarchaeota archaeon]
MVDLFRAYSYPERYAQDIDIGRIVADEKVHWEGVGRYEDYIKSGKEIPPIIVFKHPNKDEYAVLNGHHRFWAMKKMGRRSVRCVVVEDISGLGFQFAKRGMFQPTPYFTKHVRTPAKRFQTYMQEFLKNPEVMLRDQLKL